MTPSKGAAHTPSGEKNLFLEPRPVVALEPQTILVVEQRLVSEDTNESPLVIRHPAPLCEDPVPLALSHVRVIETCIPASSEKLQEDVSLDDVTLPTAISSSAASEKLLSDTAKLTETQVVLPQQPIRVTYSPIEHYLNLFSQLPCYLHTRSTLCRNMD